MLVCNVFHIYEICIQLQKTNILWLRVEVRCEKGNSSVVAVFGLIFPSYLWSHFSNIFVMWPVTAILLHSRWFIQWFPWVSLGVSHVSCQHYQCLLLILCFIFCMFSLKWKKNWISTHQARLNTDWLLHLSQDVCLHSLPLPRQQICFLKL